MRILIFGGDGMLGHELLRCWRRGHEVRVTLRRDAASYRSLPGIDPAVSRFEVDCRDLQAVVGAVAWARPEVVVNAAGIVKQRPIAAESIPSIEVNALFPHRLAEVCAAAGARLVQLSTDCVFSGAKGAYLETDRPDPQDLYGRTKLLGEVQEPHCLTLRTSIIGLEIARRTSLVEWFLAQRGPVRGYTRAIYSGLTTTEMARAIEHLLLHAPGLSGIWNLASAPISKHDLLVALAARLGRTDVSITPDDALACDRSLDGSALRARTALRVRGWPEMLDELAALVLEREHR
jgi:dTDP-4-dehydrorhamnose reductase